MHGNYEHILRCVDILSVAIALGLAMEDGGRRPQNFEEGGRDLESGEEGREEVKEDEEEDEEKEEGKTEMESKTHHIGANLGSPISSAVSNSVSVECPTPVLCPVSNPVSVQPPTVAPILSPTPAPVSISDQYPNPILTPSSVSAPELDDQMHDSAGFNGREASDSDEDLEEGASQNESKKLQANFRDSNVEDQVERTHELECNLRNMATGGFEILDHSEQVVDKIGFGGSNPKFDNTEHFLQSAQQQTTYFLYPAVSRNDDDSDGLHSNSGRELEAAGAERDARPSGEYQPSHYVQEGLHSNSKRELEGRQAMRDRLIPDHGRQHPPISEQKGIHSNTERELEGRQAMRDGLIPQHRARARHSGAEQEHNRQEGGLHSNSQRELAGVQAMRDGQIPRDGPFASEGQEQPRPEGGLHSNSQRELMGEQAARDGHIPGRHSLLGHHAAAHQKHIVRTGGLHSNSERELIAAASERDASRDTPGPPTGFRRERKTSQRHLIGTSMAAALRLRPEKKHDGPSSPEDESAGVTTRFRRERKHSHRELTGNSIAHDLRNQTQRFRGAESSGGPQLGRQKRNLSQNDLLALAVEVRAREASSNDEAEPSNSARWKNNVIAGPSYVAREQPPRFSPRDDDSGNSNGLRAPQHAPQDRDSGTRNHAASSNGAQLSGHSSGDDNSKSSHGPRDNDAMPQIQSHSSGRSASDGLFQRSCPLQALSSDSGEAMKPSPSSNGAQPSGSPHSSRDENSTSMSASITNAPVSHLSSNSGRICGPNQGTSHAAPDSSTSSSSSSRANGAQWRPSQANAAAGSLNKVDSDSDSLSNSSDAGYHRPMPRIPAFNDEFMSSSGSSSSEGGQHSRPVQGNGTAAQNRNYRSAAQRVLNNSRRFSPYEQQQPRGAAPGRNVNEANDGQDSTRARPHRRPPAIHGRPWSGNPAPDLDSENEEDDPGDPISVDDDLNPIPPPPDEEYSNPLPRFTNGNQYPGTRHVSYLPSPPVLPNHRRPIGGHSYHSQQHEIVHTYRPRQVEAVASKNSQQLEAVSADPMNQSHSRLNTRHSARDRPGAGTEARQPLSDRLLRRPRCGLIIVSAMRRDKTLPVDRRRDSRIPRTPGRVDIDFHPRIGDIVLRHVRLSGEGAVEIYSPGLNLQDGDSLIRFKLDPWSYNNNTRTSSNLIIVKAKGYISFREMWIYMGRSAYSVFKADQRVLGVGALDGRTLYTR